MIYNIIKQLQSTSSTNEKAAILESNKGITEFKKFIKQTFCPTITYDIGKKTYPEYIPNGENKDFEYAYPIIEKIQNREITGHNAINELSKIQNSLNPESAELLQYLILKDARVSIGAKSFNKVWDKLIVDIPYQRCSLPSDSLKDDIESQEFVIQQLKGDGVFGVLDYSNNKMYTRNGTLFPSKFTELFKLNTDKVVEGEIVWFPYTCTGQYNISEKPLPREISNGITNSVANGGDIPTEYFPKFLVWNSLSFKEWDSHVSKRPYTERLNDLILNILKDNQNMHVELIETKYIATLDEAVQNNNKYLSEGCEGSILKFPNGIWKYHTSKEIIKMKLEVDIDMIIESVEEATGKNAGMVGRVNVVSADGKVRCGVNSKGTMEERRHMLINFESDYKNKVTVVTANDILWNESDGIYTLFLGRTNPTDVRFDKSEADDIDRIREIFKSHGIVKDLSK